MLAGVGERRSLELTLRSCLGDEHLALDLVARFRAQVEEAGSDGCVGEAMTGVKAWGLSAVQVAEKGSNRFHVYVCFFIA